MSKTVFRVWLVIAIALWLYFGPKTFLDSRDYRQVVSEIAEAEKKSSAETLQPKDEMTLPKGAQEARNAYENALRRRETLRSRLIADLTGIAVPLVFLLFFWLAGRRSKDRSIG